mgnify:CR=1 FL=1
MDIEMFGKLSDAFGPSGFEEDVIRTIADYCKEFDVENDAMNNLYVRMPGTEKDSRPVIQLDAHLDACGFMVQNIQDNGCLGIIMLGGFHLTSLPAHAVWIRTRSGKMVHGIICAKPVHFMTTAERSSQTLEIEKMYVDVGATSREEVENVFGIHIGDPMMPDVTFEYDAEHEICFGKAFDNRAGCACIVDTMKQLEKEQASLAVNVVGAFAAQEEVGTRGAVVTSQIVKPDLAIVFEGSPSDDFFISAGQAQGCMKKGVQIRILDNSYISNTQFISLAEEVAAKCGIKYQESVRRGGSTNAAKISVTGKAVPCLVLGVPSRYAHSHYNFCAKEDLEAASAMAANVIRALDEEKIRHIWFMGGAALGGNMTPTAEFNIWVDPVAAKLVIASGIPMTMVGLDVTLKAALNREDEQEIRSFGNKGAVLAADILDYMIRRYADGGEDALMHDALAAAAAVCPQCLVCHDYFVDVECQGEYTAGHTMVDRRGRTGKKPNVSVAMELDLPVFKQWLKDCLKQCG